MKISNVFSKIEKSKAFNDFKKNPESKEAFFCAGFFILNFKNNISEYSLDFRNDKNIFTFKIPANEKKDEEVTMLKEDLIQASRPLEKIEEKEAKSKFKVDIEDIQKIIQKEMEKAKVTNSLNEIIAVLQIMDGKLLWNLTCMCEGFTILSSQINPKTGELIKFDKKNLMDFVSVKKLDKK